MKSKTLVFPLIIALSSSAMAGQFIWTGATDNTWTDVSNWDTTSTPPVSLDTFPTYGSTYASDFLTIRNNGDFITSGAGAVYNPGVGVTTTFSGGRCFVVGIGSVGTNGFADLEIRSGTIGGPNGNTTGFTPVPGVIDTAGTLSVAWPKGAGYSGVYATDFVVETSSTLSGVWVTETLGGNVIDSPTEVKYTFPGGPPYSGKNLARLKVAGPEASTDSISILRRSPQPGGRRCEL